VVSRVVWKRLPIRAYKNQVQIRRLIEVRGQLAIISTDEECQRAIREKREPICLGFPLADVIGVVKREKGAR
jgi:hypothetical protein